jgi:hypothetical protein
MSQYKITKRRLAQIIKEEYERALSEEDKKPDFADIDGDGNKEEDMEDAAEDKKEKAGDKSDKKKDLSKVPPQLRKSMEKKVKKESLDSIRDLIQKELKNL